MDEANKLLELAKKQPQTTDGFIRSVFYGGLALAVAHIPDDTQSHKKEQEVHK